MCFGKFEICNKLEKSISLKLMKIMFLSLRGTQTAFFKTTRCTGFKNLHDTQSNKFLCFWSWIAMYCESLGGNKINQISVRYIRKYIIVLAKGLPKWDKGVRLLLKNNLWATNMVIFFCQRLDSFQTIRTCSDFVPFNLLWQKKHNKKTTRVLTLCFYTDY